MFNTLQTQFTARGLCQCKKKQKSLDQLVSFAAGFWMSHIVMLHPKKRLLINQLSLKRERYKGYLYVGTLN